MRVAWYLAIGVIFVMPQMGIAQGNGTPEPGPLERLLAARPRIDRTITLDEAVTIALKESPIIRGAVAEVEAAEGRLAAARAQTRPYLSTNTFVSGGSNSSIVASPGTVPPAMLMAVPKGAFADQNLAAMYPLYTGGRLTALVRQASALQEASVADQEAQRQEVVLLTRTAYREIIARRAMIAVQQARQEENEERLRLDTLRLQQEQIPAYYIARDKAEVADATQEVANTQRDTDLAMLQLKTVMGIAPDSQLEIAATEEDKPLEISEETPTTELFRIAERHRPELAAATHRVSGATQGIAAVRGSYRPQVSLFGMADAMKMQGQSTTGGATFGVTASIPLYSGGQAQADLRVAGAEKKRLQAEEEKIALQIAQEIEAARLTLRTARQNVDTAQAAVTAAQEEYRITQVRYEAGRSIVTEVLDAQSARTRAESNLVEARFRRSVAMDQLRRALGMLNTGRTGTGA